jgi:hypothetical protein
MVIPGEPVLRHAMVTLPVRMLNTIPTLSATGMASGRDSTTPWLEDQLMIPPGTMTQDRQRPEELTI